MRHTGNFNLEWGYLAPAPSFLRSVRLVVVAATIAATASAAVVLALVRQPAAEASIAARTLVQPVEAASARRVPMAAEPQTQSEHASTPDVRHAAGPTRRDGAPALAQAPTNSSAAGSGIASGSATPRAPIATAMAETSSVTARPPQAHTAPEIAAVAAPEATPVPKTPNKKARAAAQAKDQAASASRLRVASAQHAKSPPQPAAHNVARSGVASDDLGDFRDDDSLLAKTMGVTDHVVAATQRAVSTIGVIPTWIGSIGNRLGE
jgi:hypothetical protein